MTALWGDYVGYPGGAALRAAGFTGVVRYVGIGGSAKRLTAAEYADLSGNGLHVLGVVESTTTEADNGYAAGVSDARAAQADIANLTGGRGLDFVFAANDKTTYIQADVDYVRGFADVLGVRKTGAYGFSDFLTAVRDAGVATVFWQAGHPPSITGTGGFVHFWQRQGTPGDASDGPATPTTTTVGGVTVDLDNQRLPLPKGDNVGMSNGVFERGVSTHTLPLTTNRVSEVVNQAWFSLRPAWGDLRTVHVVFEDDAANATGTETVDLIRSNTRHVLVVPDGTTGINVDWTGEAPTPGIAHVAVGWCIEYTAK
jgi:glycoside hydrolase-like protein